MAKRLVLLLIMLIMSITAVFSIQNTENTGNMIETNSLEIVNIPTNVSVTYLKGTQVVTEIVPFNGTKVIYSSNYTLNAICPYENGGILESTPLSIPVEINRSFPNFKCDGGDLTYPFSIYFPGILGIYTYFPINENGSISVSNLLEAEAIIQCNRNKGYISRCYWNDREISLNFSINQQNISICYDSDGGEFTNIKGQIISNPYTYTDFCGQYNDLTEYYCNYNNISSFKVNCTEGCFDGACIRPNNQSTTTCSIDVYNNLVLRLNTTSNSFNTLENEYSRLIRDYNNTQRSLIQLEINYSTLKQKYSTAITCDKFNENQCLAISNYCKPNYTIINSRWGKGQTNSYSSCSSLN